jgi:hypothetical protein
MILGDDQYLHPPGHKEGISPGEVVHATQADLLSSSACVRPAIRISCISEVPMFSKFYHMV